MANSFRFALVTLAGVMLVTLATVWYVGPNLVWLAFFEARSDRPYVLLQFSRGGEGLTERFSQPFAELVASENGTTVFQLPNRHTLEGRRADDWQQVGLYRLPAGQALAQVLTSSPYRTMREQSGDPALLQLGSSRLPLHEDLRGALVVWLLVSRPDATLDPLSGVLANVPGSGGRIVWDGRPDVVSAEIEWDRLLLLDFADTAAALSWLRSTNLRVERAMTRSRSHAMTVGVFGGQVRDY